MIFTGHVPEGQNNLAQRFSAGIQSSAAQERNLVTLYKPASMELEFRFDVGQDGEGVAVQGCRLEFPLLHCLDRLLIEAVSERASDTNIAGKAVGTHDQHQHNCALDLLFFRLLGIFRLHRLDDAGRFGAV